ncbi:MAG: hypothetical protein IJX53_01670 [Clostridia bacterium]|nr:hypothetical protein [Clostridia bacterium]
MTSKLALAVAILLLVLSLAGITAAAVTINAARDQVELTAATIAGDPAVLDGLDLRLRTTLGHYLFWDTAYTPASARDPETTFDFSTIRRGETSTRSYDGIELSSALSYGFSMSGSGYDEDDFANGKSGLIKAYNELYRETPLGEERTKIINLSDYYDYYPITGSIYLPEYHLSMEWEDAHLTAAPSKASTQYAAWRLNQYFKIPMLPDQMLKISLEKSADGRSVGVGAGTYRVDDTVETERYTLGSFSVVADDACYFTINARTTYGNPIDISQIEGGYGIYRLLYSGKTISIDAIENVYPLDPADGSIRWLALSPDQTRLLLYRSDGIALTLTVIDRSAMKTVQTLSLPWQYPQGEGSMTVYNGGDYHVLCLDYARMLLVEADADGVYGVSLDVAVDADSLGLGEKDNGHLRHMYSTQVMAWDGTRLAMADYMSQSGGYSKYKQACDLYLAVFTADGLQYYGIHETSLNTDTDPYNTNDSCWPMSVDPLNLTWRKTP